MGSVGINIGYTNGLIASIQHLVYHDLGHKSGSWKNRPHWNQEMWLKKADNEEKRKFSNPPDHLLKDTNSIEISLSYNGKEFRKKFHKDYSKLNIK